jgi:hypothetical protein
MTRFTIIAWAVALLTLPIETALPGQRAAHTAPASVIATSPSPHDPIPARTAQPAPGMFDVARWRAALGSCKGDAQYDAGLDRNGDGCINVLDLHRLRIGFRGGDDAPGGIAGTSEVILVDGAVTTGLPGESVSVLLKLHNNVTPLFGYSIALRAVPLGGATGTVTANVDATNFFDVQHLILADPDSAPLDPDFSVILPWNDGGVFINANTADGSTVLATPDVNDVFAEVVFDLSPDSSGSFALQLGPATALSDGDGFPVGYIFCGGVVASGEVPPNPSDLTGDGIVDGADLAILLGAWGACADPDNCPADLNCTGSIDGSDLAILLGAWG